MKTISYTELETIIVQTLGCSSEYSIRGINLIEEGLDSLRMMSIIDELGKRNIKLSFSQLMASPFLEEWWELIEQQTAEISENAYLHEKKKKKEVNIFPLTDVQHAYWVGRDETQVLGNVSCHMYFEFACKQIDVDKLKKAWSKVLYYHPSLRARFLEIGKQEICSDPYNEINVLDLRQLNDRDKNIKLEEVRRKNSHRLLRVQQGEVSALSVSLLTNDTSIIHFDIDLLSADLKSIKIIFSDLLLAYEGEELKPLPEHYKFSDFVTSASKERLADFDIGKIYWDKRIEQLPSAPELPLRITLEKIQQPKFKRRNYILDKERWELLKSYSAQKQVTPAMIFLTVYAEVLERFSTTSNFLINIPLFNRPTEFENIVADFTNILLLPVEDKGKHNFFQKVLQIKDEFLNIMQYSAYSGVRVIREILKRNPENKIIAPVVFSCDYGQPLVDEKFEHTFGYLKYISSQTPQVLIDFQIIEFTQGLMLSWDVVEEAFHQNTIDTMYECYINSLNWLLDNPERWDEELPIIPENYFAERYSNIKDFNKRRDLVLHEKIFANSAIFPENIAIIDTSIDKKISYQELVSKSKKLASLLLSNSVVRGDRVAIRLPRGSEQIVAILAVLAVGACYVPVGIKQPMDRVEKIITKARVKCIIVDSLVDEFLGVKLILMNSKILEQEEISTVVLPNPNESAYIIFTSGTTGEPKGVEVSHSAAWNTIYDVNSICKVEKEDRLFSISAMEFDLSVYDIFGILGKGGTIVLLKEGSERDAFSWTALLNKHKITIWNSVPFLLNMMLSTAEEEMIKFPSLRKVLLSGDWIGLDLPERLKQIAPNAEILAMGGATEAAIWSNYFEVELPFPKSWSSIPYGKPLFGQLYRVVDEKGRDCPNRVSGELWIGGQSVAKGYKGDEVLTQEKFVIYKDIRWYKTGDIGCFWENGLLEFLGRNDTQVKIKGHRIELGEIEFAIKKHPQVANAFVSAMGNIKNKSLAAYVVTYKEFDKDNLQIKKLVEQEELKKFLSVYLPEYMIPLKYYISKDIPLSQNGKVDRKKIEEYLNVDANTAIVNFEIAKGKLEEQIEVIWKEVLEIKKISIDDNFFEIGGDSLKAVSLISKMKKIENIPTGISIQLLFTFPSIRKFAQEIKNMNEDLEIATI